jgi:nicotinamidase-related amidase
LDFQYTETSEAANGRLPRQGGDMLQRDNVALVLVDVQGKLAESMFQREELFEALSKLVKGARLLGLPILWNEQNPEKLGPTVPQIGELLEDLAPVPKMSFSCCRNDEFMKRLQATGRGQVLLAGIETHVCIYQTALDLIELGYEVHVVVDAVSSRSAANKEIGLHAIRDAGGRWTSAEMVLFSLVRTAAAPEFRELVSIVK